MTDTEVSSAYAVGERVVYTKRTNGFTGEARVVSVDSRGVPTEVAFDDDSQGWPTYASGVREGGHWSVESGDTYARMSSTAVDAPADLSPEAAELIRVRADLITARSALRAAQSAHLRDLSTIGEALRDTAERHEWCGEYDSEVDNLLPHLSDYGRETFRESAQVSRERDFTVSFTVTLTGSTTVTASSDEEASEMVGENIGEYLDRYSASVDDVTIDDVEEA